MTVYFDVLFLIVLFAAGISDIRTRTVSNWYSIVLLALALGRMFLDRSFGHIFGILPALLILFICYRPGTGRGIGGADVKVMASAGIYLGLYQTFIMLTLACALALLCEGMKKVFKWIKSNPPNKPLHSSIPLCAWLAVGAIPATLIK